MGLEGMIEDVVKRCDFPLNGNLENIRKTKTGRSKRIRFIARAISHAENGQEFEKLFSPVLQDNKAGSKKSRRY